MQEIWAIFCVLNNVQNKLFDTGKINGTGETK